MFSKNYSLFFAAVVLEVVLLCYAAPQVFTHSATPSFLNYPINPCDGQTIMLINRAVNGASANREVLSLTNFTKEALINLCLFIDSDCIKFLRARLSFLQRSPNNKRPFFLSHSYSTSWANGFLATPEAVTRLLRTTSPTKYLLIYSGKSRLSTVFIRKKPRITPQMDFQLPLAIHSL